MRPPRKANADRRRDFNRGFAKALGADGTDAERKLWSLLRRKQMSGVRFRRQQPIGRLIADFFCPEAKLVSELDGNPHGILEQCVYDEKRTEYLEARGYRVLRFSNREVLREPERVLDVIWRAVKPRATPPRTA